MRDEENRMRARHHRDGSATGWRNILARLSYGWAIRVRMLQFASATRSPLDPRWRYFRDRLRPRVSGARLLLALLPLLARLADPRWLGIDDLDILEAGDGRTAD